MGRNLPSQRSAALDWTTERLATWTANAAAIGVDPTTVSAVSSAIATATNLRTAAGAARANSKSATASYHNAADEALDMVRDLILEVKAFAASTDDPRVYVLADLSPKANPSETPPPEAPSDVLYALQFDGSLQLRWKGKGPQGTFYVVKRKLAGESAFTMIATTTDKSFTDNAIPFGTDSVQYQILAQQTDKVVQGPVVPVKLGSGNGQQGEAAA
ncbi:MAG: hypothetical protein RIE32_06625 [Phycisphaerales bacterium]